jgi:purine-binding chemotaxis protein CheW
MDEMESIKTIKSGNKTIFGSFYLMDSEFSLSVSYIQEVVNAPAGYTSVPLSPNYLKGLFNLRGTVVPVIDLKDLLGLKCGQPNDAQKIAIIDLNGTCVGLLFDKTGEVFKNNEDERCDFDSENSDSVISGVFKKDSGKRIVQILDVTKLFKLKNIPKDSSKNRLGRESSGRKRGQKRQCISFVVGPAKCSLPISDIQEIIKVEKVSESALAYGDCIGTIDLRGTIVPVIDFPALLKYREVDRSESSTQGDRRIVVMRLEKELFGLMVDSIDSIVSFFPDELITFPVIEQSRADMFLGCITDHGDSDILLLDHQKILSNSEINEITRGHSKLYQTRDHSVDRIKSKGGTRHTYITFKIDGSYAVAINEVKEIIDYPKNLLHPPGLREHVKGVLNLRGELVTIVDARSMYLNNPSPEITASHKVLVFKNNRLHFGMVVDSVESIVTFSENDKVKLPPMIYNQSEGGMTSDISEAVQVIDSNGQKRNMLILSVDALASRATRTIAA